MLKRIVLNQETEALAINQMLLFLTACYLAPKHLVKQFQGSLSLKFKQY